MFHRIRSVQAKDDYMISSTFVDGTEKEYDMRPLFVEIPAFQNLKTVNGLFGQVRVDVGGYGVSWNDEIDLSADEIWENGRTVHACVLERA